jgi:probable F420-dependent oxidoreductase
MKIGFSVMSWGFRPEGLVDIVRLAEDLGYESVWLGEHVIFPLEFHFPHSPEGVPPFRAEGPSPDPLVLLSYVAAATTRIRLGTLIFILPLWNPLFAARSALTVDVLSKGRLTLGVGLGYVDGEFAMAGVDFRSRGRRAEESVQVLKALWTQEQPEFHGRFFDFGPVKYQPKPVQRPHPPIIFGGESEAALSRAARLGDGWCGSAHTAEDAAPLIERLRALRMAAGRKNEPFEITVAAVPWPRPGAAVDVDGIRRYQEVGVDRLIVSPWPHVKEATEGLERYAREVLAKLPQS